MEALYVAIPSLLILFLWDFFEKKFKYLKNIPSPLVALFVGTGDFGTTGAGATCTFIITGWRDDGTVA